MANETTQLLPPLARPRDVKVIKDLTGETVSIFGYSSSAYRILTTSPDEVENFVSLKTYDEMEKDSIIAKCKMILITSCLSDELQMAPGATEDEVGPQEYKTYEEVMKFCQRVISGLDGPIRSTLQQLLGNAIKYGHGIAESEWDYRVDGPKKIRSSDKQPIAKRSRLSAALSRFGITSKTQIQDEEIRPSLRATKTKLMPVGLKVKPRDTVRFVVDEYSNVLGLTPKFKDFRRNIRWDEIIDREKFLILTLNKRDEDPRGVSMYRPAFNWYNLKREVPTEMLRFILEETVPKAVATLGERNNPYEFERDENNNVVYDDPPTNKRPKFKTATESMGSAVKNFRAGSGAVIPYGAKLEPFKKTGSSDADVFGKILKAIDNQMENAILLQVLAQSEGEHQARSASQQVAELLYNLVFWIKWTMGQVLMYDLLEVAIRKNFGEWALGYMPQISLGDFTRRDWVTELAAIADAYDKGLLDDTQRPELMSWLNMPRPGLSRYEIDGERANALKVQRDSKPNTEKNNGNKNTKTNTSSYGLGSRGLMGHNGGWIRSYHSNRYYGDGTV